MVGEEQQGMEECSLREVFVQEADLFQERIHTFHQQGQGTLSSFILIITKTTLLSFFSAVGLLSKIRLPGLSCLRNWFKIQQ